MNIVVLDGYTLNPGDLSWEGLERLGELRVHDRSSPEEAIERSKSAEILFTNKAIVSKEAIEGAKDLRYIGVLATGVNIVDLEAAKNRRIPVCNARDYGSASVAQMVFAHILNFCQRVAEHGADVSKGGWTVCPDFCYWKFPLVELEGQTLGIVGLGKIGKATAKVAQGFGMRVIATTRDASKPAPEGVEWVSQDELFEQSDYISLHCPLTDETEKMINEQRLRQMKRSAFLINTGRGQLVDESALTTALNEGRIAGAGVDVLSSEPPSLGNPLLKAKNCVVTPHIAWATRAARQRLLDQSVENLQSFLDGKTLNQVNE